MITLNRFLEGIESIYVEQPSYELGHDGSDGKCDCIGMPRGASKRAGETDIRNFSGTNMAARKTIAGLKEIRSESQLELGDVVLKTRDKDDPSMPLPDRYRKGGADYDAKWGEINFSHIGTVTSVNPLIITHMTSPTAKKDTKLGKWTYAGKLPWVDYKGGGGEVQHGRVEAPTGSTVNLRRAPNRGAALVDRIPIGTMCEILEEQGEWDRISVSGKTGWMMAQYISKEIGTDTLYEITIQGLDLSQARALQNNYPGSIIKEMTVG